MAVGGRIGFFTGDPLRLLEDAQLLKPNFFPSVPRVLNRIYQAAMAAGDAPGLKGNIFRKAMATKLQRFRTTGEVIHPLWDRIVFRKVRYPEPFPSISCTSFRSKKFLVAKSKLF